MIHLVKGIDYLLVAFKHRGLEEVCKLYVLADDLSRDLKDVLKRVNALKVDLSLVDNELKALAAAD